MYPAWFLMSSTCFKLKSFNHKIKLNSCKNRIWSLSSYWWLLGQSFSMHKKTSPLFKPNIRPGKLNTARWEIFLQKKMHIDWRFSSKIFIRLSFTTQIKRTLIKWVLTNFLRTLKMNSRPSIFLVLSHNKSKLVTMVL
jgi:hypothetical protein